MTTLLHHELFSREFGSSVLHVPSLLAWATSRKLAFPGNALSADLDYIQAEALLAAVASSCGTLSDRDAVGMLAAVPDLVRKSIADQALAADIIADPSPDYARALLGAAASYQWRKVLDQAIAGHEMVLRDPHSLLPIDALVPPKVGDDDTAEETRAERLATAGNSPAVASAESTAKGIDKRAVMLAFDGVRFSYEKWGTNLASPPDWLLPCRVMKGDKSKSALWNPVKIAVELHAKGITLKKLDAVFVGLNDWVDDWRDASAKHRP